MSLSYSNWLSGTLMTAQERTLREQERAADAWHRINEKKTTIILRTAAGVNRAAQDVRLEWSNSVSESTSAAGAAPVRPLVIFGVKGHSTISDTVIAEGDRFVYLNDSYRVVDVIYSIGEVQAIAEAV